MHPTFLFRICLVALFVVSAYQFEWRWLRFATSEAVMHLCHLLGLPAVRVSFDIIRMRGEAFRFDIGCTFADVIVG